MLTSSLLAVLADTLCPHPSLFAQCPTELHSSILQYHSLLESELSKQPSGEELDWLTIGRHGAGSRFVSPIVTVVHLTQFHGQALTVNVLHLGGIARTTSFLFHISYYSPSPSYPHVYILGIRDVFLILSERCKKLGQPAEAARYRTIKSFEDVWYRLHILEPVIITEYLGVCAEQVGVEVDWSSDVNRDELYGKIHKALTTD